MDWELNSLSLLVALSTSAMVGQDCGLLDSAIHCFVHRSYPVHALPVAEPALPPAAFAAKLDGRGFPCRHKHEIELNPNGSTTVADSD